MSNLEVSPQEIVGDPLCGEKVEVVNPRQVPLGGPRAMTVRRTLPTRARSLVGPWCFVDHYGPAEVAGSGGMRVPRHPHTGLATVSWLFSGEVEHIDSAGHEAIVRPGSINLMVAGAGISHSEFSTPETSVLHGVQLWYALPHSTRGRPPSFEAHTPEPVALDDATIRVFLGTVAGVTSPVQMFADGFGAEVVLPPGGSVELDLPPGAELGVLVDCGSVEAAGYHLEAGQLGYLPPGLTALQLIGSTTTRTRVLVLGGPPFGEQIVMWWNFVARTHEEIVQARQTWQAEIEPDFPGPGLFGPWSAPERSPSHREGALPAPELPKVRLRPRGES